MRNCACGNTEVFWPKVEKMNEIAQLWMFILLRMVPCWCDGFFTEESCFLIEQYFHKLSFDAVFELFNKKSGSRRLHNTLIICVVDCFQTHHIISHRKGRGGRVTVRIFASWEDVRQRITNNLRLSIWKLAATVQISRASVHHTLRNLKLHPYHFSVQHDLKLTNYACHWEFCQWFNHSVTSFVMGLTHWITFLFRRSLDTFGQVYQLAELSSVGHWRP